MSSPREVSSIRPASGVVRAADPLVRFGSYQFSPTTGELWARGASVSIQPQPAALLAELLREPGRVVPRERLYEVLWPERIVAYDQALNFTVARLRKALGDDAARPSWVETVPHVGYRFVGQVEVVKPTFPGVSGPGRRWLRWVFAAGFLLAGIAAFVALGLSDRLRTTGADRLVVLPFEWIGSEPDSAAIGGLFEDLITELAMLDTERLAVIGPESARRAGATRIGIDSLASLLQVDWVVSGSFAKEGTAGVRVNSRLTRVSDRRVVWAERFVRNPREAYLISSPIAGGVVEILSLSPSGPPAALRDEALPVAARRELREARYLMETGDSAAMAMAGQRLTAALPTAPQSAALHSEMAEWHARRAAWDSARVHAEAAIAADRRDPRGHRQLARVLLESWDVKGAGRHYRRAVDLAPGVVLYHAVLPAYLTAVGDHDGAVRHLERALELDPLTPSVYRDLGWTLVTAGEPERAIPVCRQHLRLHPADAEGMRCLYRAFAVAGRPDSAAVYARRLMELQGGDVEVLDRAREASPPAKRLGIYRAWNAQRLDSLYARDAISAYFPARAQALLGHADAAFRYLDAALKERTPWLLYLEAEPWFDPIRDDPRFHELVSVIEAEVAAAESPSPRGARRASVGR